jgi:hypothetical protein
MEFERPSLEEILKDTQNAKLELQSLRSQVRGVLQYYSDGGTIQGMKNRVQGLKDTWTRTLESTHSLKTLRTSDIIAARQARTAAPLVQTETKGDQTQAQLLDKARLLPALELTIDALSTPGLVKLQVELKTMHGYLLCETQTWTVLDVVFHAQDERDTAEMPSKHTVFQLVSEHVRETWTALASTVTSPSQAMLLLLDVLASYDRLFKSPCSVCNRYLALDTQGELLPAYLRTQDTYKTEQYHATCV